MTGIIDKATKNISFTNLNLTKEKLMKNNKGIAVLLFAILLKLCGANIIFALSVGITGLLMAIFEK